MFMKLSIKRRVVIDTNIFISAFIWGGNSKKVVNFWLEEKFILVISPFLLTEILLILRRFNFSSVEIKKLRRVLESHTLRVFPKQQINLCRDPKDNMVLTTCRASRADYLVTGDKDLLSLKKFKSTLIFTPREFLKFCV